MNVRYQKSFDKTFDRLSRADQQKTTEAVNNLLTFFETKERPSKGAGLKKLRKNFWEIRATLHVRILFQLENDILTFILAGNHDDIRRYIRQL